MSIVNRIKALCNSQNINFAELERRVGLGNGAIRRWDTTCPSVDRLEKVANYFNVSTDFLLGRDIDKNKNLEENYFSIERRAKKMSPEDRARLLQLMDVAFTEAFSEDDEEDLDI